MISVFDGVDVTTKMMITVRYEHSPIGTITESFVPMRSSILSHTASFMAPATHLASSSALTSVDRTYFTVIAGN